MKISQKPAVTTAATAGYRLRYETWFCVHWSITPRHMDKCQILMLYRSEIVPPKYRNRRLAGWEVLKRAAEGEVRGDSSSISSRAASRRDGTWNQRALLTKSISRETTTNRLWQMDGRIHTPWFTLWTAIILFLLWCWAVIFINMMRETQELKSWIQ